jgi:hypothetical protein
MHSLARGGWESPSSDEGTFTVVLCKYTYFVHQRKEEETAAIPLQRSLLVASDSQVNSSAASVTRPEQMSESVATLPPFSPIEGQKWFDQISSQ